MLLVATLAGVASVGFVQAPALADSSCPTGYFCAWDGENYTGAKLIQSSAPPGTDNIDVADDRVSSVKNNTGNRWCGVNNGFPGDDTVLSVARYTNLPVLDSKANNKIDHFYVVAGAGNCT